MLTDTEVTDVHGGAIYSRTVDSNCLHQNTVTLKISGWMTSLSGDLECFGIGVDNFIDVAVQVNRVEYNVVLNYRL